jgi:hypothetical protein
MVVEVVVAVMVRRYDDDVQPMGDGCYTRCCPSKSGQSKIDKFNYYYF